MTTLTPDQNKTTFYLKKNTEYKIQNPEIIHLVSGNDQRIGSTPITKESRGTPITQSNSIEVSNDITDVYIIPTENIELEIQQKVV